ncbi:MAG TPA: uracil-DNA glycosylase [Thermoanaerobaculia bacterium]|nr:uracil-DNA glycosylase [Thermoanaerobaculia bacterium]
MSRRFDRFIDALSRTIVSERACNQYSRIEGDLHENAIRRRNLRLYLSDFDAIGPRMLLIGEAPSYRGGRLTGIPFVSETVMFNILGADRGYRKATRGPRLSTEASATMVWSTIREIEPLPILWNAFPFHPFHSGQPNSNRVPTPAELAIGAPFIEWMLRLFPITLVVAIGNQASISLRRLGIEHDRVRHPSQGGKRMFVEGMMKSTKSAQLQQIKEGLAMRQKTYSGRLQPFGPKAPLPTKNAVNLSTVPSSANEKFNGGKDE